MQFNKQQLDAIKHKDGACGVIAGAGSGKSTVLVNRIKELTSKGINPNRIMAITFTRNSANDLKSKLNKLKITNVKVGTFHSICGQILQNHGLFTTRRPQEYEIANLFKSKNNNEKIDYKDIMSFISYQKNYMISCDDEFIYKNSQYSEDILRYFYKEYENYKIKYNMLDFDDLLLNTYKLLKNNNNNDNDTCDYILVDEHQDSNLVQNELIDLLCPTGNIFCVFDYRQAIYTFRGGNPEYCMDFKNKYPDAKIINLDINYRSYYNIVSSANDFMENYYGNYQYYSPSIADSNKSSDTILYTSFDKKDESIKIVDEINTLIKKGIKPNEIAVLFRLNSQIDYIENELKKRNIEYNIESNRSFFKRKEISVILNTLRLIQNPKDNIAYEELFKSRVCPFTYIRNTVLEEIKLTSSKFNIPFISASELVNSNRFRDNKSLKSFSSFIDKLTRHYNSTKSLTKLIDNILNGLKIYEYIENNSINEEEIRDRTEGLNSFKKFIKTNTLESFLKYVYGKNKIQPNDDKNKIQLMTIHKSKGLEFNHTFIIGVEDGKFPNNKTEIIDEARLFYVAITRARNNLYLSQINDDNLFINQYFNKNINIAS